MNATVTNLPEKTKRKHTDKLGPIKALFQNALVGALTSVPQNLSIIDTAVRQAFASDPKRAQNAFSEIFAPVLQNAPPGSPFAQVLTPLKALVETESLPKIQGITRVTNGKTMLMIPRVPGLEDVAAVKLSTMQTPANPQTGAPGKTVIILEPFSSTEFEAKLKEVATVLPNAA